MSSPTPPADLTEADLGKLGPKLGEGGQARVYELPALRLPESGTHRLVYKQYKAGHAPRHGMRQLVAVRARLQSDPALLARLDASAAWPVRQVVDATGAVAGLILPRIPDEFFHNLRLPSGGTKRIPRDVQFLMIPPDRAMAGGMPAPSPETRLRVCRDFAATLAVLHDDLNVVFGDINPRNTVFRLDPEPKVMLVDCDAVRVSGSMAAVAQLNAPDWDPPGSQNVLSRSTDLYKLGLFVLRCLTPERGGSINRDPAHARWVLDATGLTMLRGALSAVEADRPSADAWRRYLSQMLGEALVPPQLTRIDLDRGIVATGQPVTLTWGADDAQTIEVRSPGSPDVATSGAAGRGTVTLYPARTGPITVTARNNLGEHTQKTGPVAVFQVATFEDLQVPLPQLDLPVPRPAELPQVAAALPGLPVPVGVPPPAAARLVGPWAEPEDRPEPPLDPLAPPPGLGLGPLAMPVDLTGIMTGAPDPEDR